MREYKYVVKDESGKKLEGIRKADCQQDVLAWARDNYYVPISIDEAVRSTQKKRRSSAFKASTTDIANFCWQLATMMEGGISITESLDTIADDIGKPNFSRIIFRISDGIKSGESFSKGLAEFPGTFDNLFQGMIFAGETSGSMPMVLRRLADYYENRDKIIKKVRGAMIYPVFVVGFIFVIVTVMAVFIIPRFRTVFDTIGGELPAFTEAFLGVYDFMMTGAIFYVPAITALVVILVLYCKTKKGHEKLGRFTLSLPLFGKIILLAFVALFCRTISAMLSAGVSVLDSLEIMGSMSKNDTLKNAILVAKENITSGSSITSSLAATKVFPKLILKMVKVGEQTGALPEVLDKTADYYQRKVEDRIDNLIKMLEPFLIIVVGGIVLVVILALYLPIFTMSDVN